MGHTYTSLLYHVVFSTKERRALLTVDIKPRLIQFVGGIIRHREGKLLAMNGPVDHVHLLAILAPKMAVADQVRDIKALSSGWVHDEIGERSFAWQEGYAAFTVGKSGLDSVIRYIDGQERHHRKQTFEEEFIAMLKRAGVEYDPKYVFD